MFTPFSSINSKRTSQDALKILVRSSPKEIDAGSCSSGQGIFRSESIHSDPPSGCIFSTTDRSNTIFPNAARKPGSRLGLKRVVTKTMNEGPPNKKEREATPLPKGTRCFSVLFAKPQTKKNKTWENDGYLIVKNSSLTLKSTQGDIVSCGRLISQVLEEGNQFGVGDKVVQIQDELLELPLTIQG
ncbi:uncharacterized protein LOC114828389 [Galendromus occidentalis]|uniref:Uncharacterized protein LOC114828389 n=1 Tax=Galendromus occidentalis TaxID=34638 RepID=A0AAJ7SHH8_9ACAR|nr:uncharacterized protein LOC114828389 [Galendromus occidentalis]